MGVVAVVMLVRQSQTATRGAPGNEQRSERAGRAMLAMAWRLGDCDASLEIVVRKQARGAGSGERAAADWSGTEVGVEESSPMALQGERPMQPRTLTAKELERWAQR